MALNQRIYEDSPESHQKNKAPQPWGGVIIFLSFIIGALLLGKWTMTTMWVVTTTVLFFIIGAIDDGLS